MSTRYVKKCYHNHVFVCPTNPSVKWWLVWWAEGTYSEIYIGTRCDEQAIKQLNSQSNNHYDERVAIKVQKSSDSKQLDDLYKECDVLSELANTGVVCNIIHAPKRDDPTLLIDHSYNPGSQLPNPTNQPPFIAMSLLICNISELRRKLQQSIRQPNDQSNNRPINPPGFNRAAMFDCFQLMAHSLIGYQKAGYLHRDVKPSNFGLAYVNDPTATQSNTQLNHQLINPVTNQPLKQIISVNPLPGFRLASFIFDFGQSQPVMINNSHNLRCDFAGKSYYASVNRLKGNPQGRCDDWVMLFFAFADFLLNDLPWKTIYDNREDGKYNDRGRAAILELKKDFILPVPNIESVKQCISQLPAEFMDMLRRLSNAAPESEPPYDDIINLLIRLRDDEIKNESTQSNSQSIKQSTESLTDLVEQFKAHPDNVDWRKKMRERPSWMKQSHSQQSSNQPTNRKSISQPIKPDTPYIQSLVSVQKKIQSTKPFIELFRSNNQVNHVLKFYFDTSSPPNPSIDTPSRRYAINFALQFCSNVNDICSKDVYSWLKKMPSSIPLSNNQQNKRSNTIDVFSLVLERFITLVTSHVGAVTSAHSHSSASQSITQVITTDKAQSIWKDILNEANSKSNHELSNSTISRSHTQPLDASTIQLIHVVHDWLRSRVLHKPSLDSYANYVKPVDQSTSQSNQSSANQTGRQSSSQTNKQSNVQSKNNLAISQWTADLFNKTTKPAKQATTQSNSQSAQTKVMPVSASRPVKTEQLTKSSKQSIKADPIKPSANQSSSPKIKAETIKQEIVDISSTTDTATHSTIDLPVSTANNQTIFPSATLSSTQPLPVRVKSSSQKRPKTEVISVDEVAAINKHVEDQSNNSAKQSVNRANKRITNQPKKSALTNGTTNSSSVVDRVPDNTLDQSIDLAVPSADSGATQPAGAQLTDQSTVQPLSSSSVVATTDQSLGASVKQSGDVSPETASRRLVEELEAANKRPLRARKSTITQPVNQPVKTEPLKTKSVKTELVKPNRSGKQPLGSEPTSASAKPVQVRGKRARSISAGVTQQLPDHSNTSSVAPRQTVDGYDNALKAEVIQSSSVASDVPHSPSIVPTAAESPDQPPQVDETTDDDDVVTLSTKVPRSKRKKSNLATDQEASRSVKQTAKHLKSKPKSAEPKSGNKDKKQIAEGFDAKAGLARYEAFIEKQSKHVQSLKPGQTVKIELVKDNAILKKHLKGLQIQYPNTDMNIKGDDPPFKILEKVHMLSDGQWYNGVVIAFAHTDDVLWAMQDDDDLPAILYEKKLWPIPGLQVTLNQFDVITQIPSYQRYCYAISWAKPFINSPVEWSVEPVLRHGWIVEPPKLEKHAVSMELLGRPPTQFELDGDLPSGYTMWPPVIRVEEELWEVDPKDEKDLAAFHARQKEKNNLNNHPIRRKSTQFDKNNKSDSDEKKRGISEVSKHEQVVDSPENDVGPPAVEIPSTDQPSEPVESSDDSQNNDPLQNASVNVAQDDLTDARMISDEQSVILPVDASVNSHSAFDEQPASEATPPMANDDLEVEIDIMTAVPAPKAPKSVSTKTISRKKRKSVIAEHVISDSVVDEPVIDEPVIDGPVHNDPVHSDPVINDHAISELVNNGDGEDELRLVKTSGPVISEPVISESVDNDGDDDDELLVNINNSVINEPVISESVENDDDDDELLVNIAGGSLVAASESADCAKSKLPDVTLGTVSTMIASIEPTPVDSEPQTDFLVLAIGQSAVTTSINQPGSTNIDTSHGHIADVDSANPARDENVAKPILEPHVDLAPSSEDVLPQKVTSEMVSSVLQQPIEEAVVSTSIDAMSHVLDEVSNMSSHETTPLASVEQAANVRQTELSPALSGHNETDAHEPFVDAQAAYPVLISHISPAVLEPPHSGDILLEAENTSDAASRMKPSPEEDQSVESADVAHDITTSGVTLSVCADPPLNVTPVEPPLVAPTQISSPQKEKLRSIPRNASAKPVPAKLKRKASTPGTSSHAPDEHSNPLTPKESKENSPRSSVRKHDFASTVPLSSLSSIGSVRSVPAIVPNQNTGGRTEPTATVDKVVNANREAEVGIGSAPLSPNAPRRASISNDNSSAVLTAPEKVFIRKRKTPSNSYGSQFHKSKALKVEASSSPSSFEKSAELSLADVPVSKLTKENNVNPTPATTSDEAAHIPSTSHSTTSVTHSTSQPNHIEHVPSSVSDVDLIVPLADHVQPSALQPVSQTVQSTTRARKRKLVTDDEEDENDIPSVTVSPVVSLPVTPVVLSPRSEPVTTTDGDAHHEEESPPDTSLSQSSNQSIDTSQSLEATSAKKPKSIPRKSSVGGKSASRSVHTVKLPATPSKSEPSIKHQTLADSSTVSRKGAKPTVLKPEDLSHHQQVEPLTSPTTRSQARSGPTPDRVASQTSNQSINQPAKKRKRNELEQLAQLAPPAISSNLRSEARIMKQTAEEAAKEKEASVASKRASVSTKVQPKRTTKKIEPVKQKESAKPLAKKRR